MILPVASTLSSIVRVVWSSVLASVVVACVFSFAVVAIIRGAELRRVGRGSLATAYTAAAIAALGVCLGAVVYGVILVGQK